MSRTANHTSPAPTPSLANPHRVRSEVRRVMAMAIPVVLATGSRGAMDVADYILITLLHSDAAQAAILPAQMIMWSCMVIGMGVVSMVNTFASQSLGRGDHRECSAYAWQTLPIAALFAVLTLCAYPWIEDIVRLMGHASDVQQAELAYAKVAVFTIGPTTAATGLAAFFTGIHRPYVALWSVVEANLINIAVSSVLMFGLLGVEPMGIAGAAWGTLIAGSYRTLRLALVLLSESSARDYASRSTWRPSWSRLMNLLRIGLPTSLQWLNEVFIWGLFVAFLVGRQFGTADLIATNTVWQYMRIAFIPAMGLGQALTALVGKSIGSGNVALAQLETRIGAVLTLIYMGCLSIIYGLFGGSLIAVFSSDPNVASIGKQVMICAAVFQLFDALSISYLGALRGAGDTLVPGIFYVLTNWLLILGGGWLMVISFPELRSLGPWLAASVVLIMTGIFLWWRWRRGGWQRIDIFGKRGKTNRVVSTEQFQTTSELEALE